MPLMKWLAIDSSIRGIQQFTFSCTCHGVFSCGIGEVGLASIFSCHITLRYIYVLLSILFYLLQVGECKFSKLNTIIKDGITYLVLLMGVLCNEGQLKSVVQFDFCDSGQFLSDLTLGDESVIGIVINLLGALVNCMDCICFPGKLYVQSSCLK